MSPPPSQKKTPSSLHPSLIFYFWGSESEPFLFCLFFSLSSRLHPSLIIIFIFQFNSEQRQYVCYGTCLFFFLNLFAKKKKYQLCAFFMFEMEFPFMQWFLFCLLANFFFFFHRAHSCLIPSSLPLYSWFVVCWNSKRMLKTMCISKFNL